MYRCASEGKEEISTLFIPEHVHKIQQLPGSNYRDEFISQGDILQLFYLHLRLGLTLLLTLSQEYQGGTNYNYTVNSGEAQERQIF